MKALCAVVPPPRVETVPLDAWTVAPGLLGLLLCCAVYHRFSSRILADLGRVSRETWTQPAIPRTLGAPEPLEPSRRTAVLVVSGFNAFGLRSLMALWRAFPGYFPQVLFLGVAAGEDGPEDRARMQESLRGYCRVAGVLGMAAGTGAATGDDPVLDAERACLGIAESFASVVFVAGSFRIRPPRWYHRFLADLPAAVLRRLRRRGFASAMVEVDSRG